jgi:hypothetical protein
MDTCFRLAEYWIPQLKPKMVILMPPHEERLELIDGDGTPRLYSAHGFSPGAREWLAHPENSRLSSLKNIWAIRDLCQRGQIPFHYWHLMDFYKLAEQKRSYGRDLAHPGTEAHRIFAEKVLREI